MHTERGPNESKKIILQRQSSAVRPCNANAMVFFVGLCTLMSAIRPMNIIKTNGQFSLKTHCVASVLLPCCCDIRFTMHGMNYSPVCGCFERTKAPQRFSELNDDVVSHVASNRSQDGPPVFNNIVYCVRNTETDKQTPTAR